MTPDRCSMKSVAPVRAGDQHCFEENISGAPARRRTPDAGWRKPTGKAGTAACDDPETQPRFAAFRHELAALGRIEAYNIEINVRFDAPDLKSLSGCPGVVVNSNSSSISPALLKEARAIPSCSQSSLTQSNTLHVGQCALRRQLVEN